MKVLAINGSYRTGGVTDQAVAGIVTELQRLGVDVKHVALRDHPIEFCLNCRQCMQQPGHSPGTCVQDDGMQALVDWIEAADGFVLAAPTNFSSVTALFKRFMERLAVYGYWPWGRNSPVFRKKALPKKPAVLVSSCAAPGVFGRLFYATNKELKIAASTIGARVVGSMFTGMISDKADVELPRRAQRRAKALAARFS